MVLYISRLEKKINTSELKLIILTLGPVLGQFSSNIFYTIFYIFVFVCV